MLLVETRPETVLVHCVLDEDPIRVLVSGDVDLTAKPSLDRACEMLAAFELLAERPSGDVEVDLSAVEFFDCAGLSFLVRLRNRLRTTGRRVVVTQAAAPVDRTIRVAGLGCLLRTTA